MTATQQAETVDTKPKIGRPTEYKPEFCAVVVELGSQGKSQAQMAAHFGVTKQSITDWKNRHPEFSDALARANVLAQAHLEDLAYNGLNDSKFNANLFKIIAYNRFRDDYADRKEVSIEANHLIHHSVLQSLAAPQVIDGEAEEVEFQGDE